MEKEYMKPKNCTNYPKQNAKYKNKIAIYSIYSEPSSLKDGVINVSES